MDETRRALYHENGFRTISAHETLNKTKKLFGRFGIITGYPEDRKDRVEVLAADPMGNNVRRCSSGKGLTHEQIKASAVMEAIERYCSKMHPGERILTAPYKEVKSVAKDPRAFHLSRKFPVRRWRGSCGR